MRCELHGLAVASDGKCVLCRRPPSSVPARAPKPSSLPPPPAGNRGVLSLVLVSAVLLSVIGLCVGAMVARSLAAKDGGAARAVDCPEDSSTEVSEPGSDEASGGPEHEEPRRQPPEIRDRLDADQAQGDSDNTADRREVEEEAFEPVPQRPEPPTRAELDRAFRSVEVKVYVTQTCPVCRRAQAWLSRNGIPHRSLDIRVDPRARERMLRLNPEGSVPTFEIDTTVLTGFGERTVSRTIASAAERHLRMQTGKDVRLEAM